MIQFRKPEIDMDEENQSPAFLTANACLSKSDSLDSIGVFDLNSAAAVFQKDHGKAETRRRFWVYLFD